jgi:hypothetical protein
MRQRVLPLAILVVSLGWLAYLWWGQWSEVRTVVYAASSLAIIAAIAGVVIAPAAARAHAAVAGCLMLVLASFTATRAIGKWPFAWDSMPDARYAAVIAILGAAVGIGLVCGAFWARWGAIAFAASAGLGGLLNSYNMRAWRDESAWLAAIGVIGAAVILSQLLRPSVNAHFARRAQHAVWASRDRLIASALWAAIANLGAAPMLLLYALGQPVAPSTVWAALVLAPVLAIGSALVVARRTAGIAILAAGGLGLLAHTAMTLHAVPAFAMRTAGYYTVFWMPAALLGLVAGSIAFARARRG